MSRLWVFKNGVYRLVENPASENSGSSRPRKVLLHKPTNQVVNSYAALERLLQALGWDRYYDDPSLLQYHKTASVHLISLPESFSHFNSVHMYDIVVKNRNIFEGRDG